MAANFTFAQHLVQCDECEKNPATYVCKTCPGRLCDECKAKHEQRKITKTHDITEFSTQKTEFLELRYCSEHKEKRFECFCGDCKIPICTECIIESHNGHNIQKFTAVRDDLQKKKDEIEENLLPRFTMLIAIERNNSSELSKQAGAIESQIKEHTRRLIEKTKEISENALKDLKVMENVGLKEIDSITVKYEEKIAKLQQTNKMLIEKIENKHKTSPLNPDIEDIFEEFRDIPVPVNYRLTSFQPGKIDQVLKKCFGKFPRLEKELQEV